MVEVRGSTAEVRGSTGEVSGSTGEVRVKYVEVRGSTRKYFIAEVSLFPPCLSFWNF
jgi:hypothetical protein